MEDPQLEVRLREGARRFGFTGMDPRADWLLGPGIHDFLPDGGAAMMIPCTFLLEPGATIDSADGLFYPLQITDPARAAYANKKFEIVPGFAARSFLEALAEPEGPYRDLQGKTKAVVLGSPLAPEVLPFGIGDEPPVLKAPSIEPPTGGWPPGTVVIGVIDDGIAFAHRRFRLTDKKSRVEAIWLQGALPVAPLTVDFGRELTKSVIDDLLDDFTANDWLDEAGLYRAAGLVDFGHPGHKAAAWRAAHGTHVLDLAAAIEPGADPRSRPIIAVDLPTAAVADTSFKLLTQPVLAAITYILNRAAMLTEPGDPPLPLVICFSFGMYAGPHDGSHPVEQALDDLIETAPSKRTAVLPAGNSHLERTHAEIRFPPPPEVEATLPWRVQPDDRTPSSVEIWMPYGGEAKPAPSRVRLALVPPHGLAGTAPPVWLGEDDTAVLEILDAAGRVIGQASWTFVGAPTFRGVFTIELQPTTRLAPFDPALPVAPAGVWTIRLLREALPADARLQAWVQRDDAPYGYPIRGRQSYFDDPAHVRHDFRGEPVEEDDHPGQVAAGVSLVKRVAHLNAIASGARVIVAGGWWQRQNRVARYSAGGPANPLADAAPDTMRRKPDVLALADTSRALRGVLAAGTASGSVVAFTGTSVAAPQVARHMAQRLAAGQPVDRDSLRDDVLGGGPPPAREREGWAVVEVPPVVRVPR